MRLYDNSRTVDDEAAILRDFQQRSAQAYADYAHYNVHYGEHERHRIDIFHNENDTAPLLIFIHGGYWQWCDKEDFAFVVPTPLKMGLDVALVEYPLTPDVSFSQLVHSIGQALDCLTKQARYQGQSVYLCGHSAGGHLSALWQNHSWVTHTIAISGLYDLKPISQTHLNEALHLSEQDILNYSPVLQDAASKPLHIVYGLHELDELQWQSTQYAAHTQTPHVHATDDNHYTILDRVFSAPDAILADLLKS